MSRHNHSPFTIHNIHTNDQYDRYTNDRHPGVVYADVHNEYGCIRFSGTLEMCAKWIENELTEVSK